MAYIYDLSDTWNAAGTTFFGIKMNVTNSASASGSKLLSLQVASTEYFGVDKNGNVTIGNGGDLRISSATGGDDSIIYNDAEDLYFNTNGAVRAVINSSGNIGVGTSSPQSRFHVDVPAGGGSFFTGTGNYNGGYPTAVFGLNIGYNFQAGAADVDFFNSWTGATGSQGGFSFRRQTGASSQTSLMRIDGSGNVGIGTSSPVDKLSVSDGIATFQFKPLGGSSIGYMGMRTNHALGFTTNDTERMRIDSSGNVGIGTSSPGTKLDVLGAIRINAANSFQWYGASGGTNQKFWDTYSDNSSGNVLYFRAVNDAYSAAYQWLAVDRSGEQPQNITFYTGAASERMRINSSGYVGIGTSGPSGKLDVRGSTGTTAIINSYNDSSSGNVASVFSNLQSNANSTSSYHYAGVTQGVNIWYLYGNGTSSWSSDQRLKKNIESTRDGYLDDLCQLRVVKYNWHTDADDKPRELGLIAQEVEAVFPGLVEEALQDIDDTGIRYKVLKGSVLPYMLLKALQEANAKIEALTARVAQLEGN